MPAGGRRRGWTLLLAPVLLLSLGLSSAWAHGFHNVYGVGSRAVAMGSAYTALANDASATFYNVAALPETGPGMMEVLLTRNLIGLDMELEGSYWNEIMDLWEVESTEELAAIFEDADELTTVGISMAVPLWKPREKALASFGFLINAPLEYAVRFYFVDSHDLVLLDYTNIANTLNIMMGFGFDISGILDQLWDVEMPGLSVGFGIDAFFDGVGELEMVPMPVQMELNMPFNFTFTGGVLLQPFETLTENKVLESVKLGVSYIQEMALYLDFDMNFTGMTGGFYSYDLWSIEQWGFGLGIDPTEHLTLGYEATLFKWSGFEPPYMVGKEEGGAIVDLMAPKFEWEDFKDIWVNRVGVEYRLLKDDSLKLRGGYFLRPSPVPDQTANTNFVDTDTHAICMGLGYDLSDSMSVSTHAQYRILAERKMEKAEDVGSSLTVSGSTWNFGLTFTFSLEGMF